LILTKIKYFAISKFANPFNSQLLLFLPAGLGWNTFPKEMCECLTLLLTFVINPAHCVKCKVRNKCHHAETPTL